MATKGRRVKTYRAEYEQAQKRIAELEEDVSVARQSLYEVAEQRETLLRRIKALEAQRDRMLV